MDMNVFRQDAFSAIEMTMAIDRMSYVPSFLQSIPGLVKPAPVRTEEIWIEDRAYAAQIIQTSPRGAAPDEIGGDKRQARAFKTVRIAQGSTITPSELQNIRAFGSTSELKSLQLEIGRRNMKIKQNFQLTKEYWTLAMIQGKALDKDGSVLYDWSSEFSRAQPAEVPFSLAALVATDDGSITKNSNTITRQILRKLQGLGGNQVAVFAACGDQFWDQLTTSKEVKDTYKNWQAAEALRNDTSRTFSAMKYASIYWFNYRGTDDNSTVAIQTDKVKFFPVGADIFQWAMSPGEQFEFVNTLGKDMYSWMAIDPIRNMWARAESASYFLPVCVAPDALASGRAGG